MRVTINYTKEFEEIPVLLQELVEECDVLNKKADGLLTIVSYAMASDDAGLLAKAIHDLRVVLNKIDSQISDVADMSSGYYKAKAQLETPPEVVPEEPEQGTEEPLPPEEPEPEEKQPPTQRPKIRTFHHMYGSNSKPDPRDSQGEDDMIYSSPDAAYRSDSDE